MRRSSLPLGLFAALLTAAAIGVSAPPARGQSYGPGDQVLTVGPAQFQLFSSDSPHDFGQDGYLYQSDLTGASGITAGCGTGVYCPDAPLTRGQMAVFLSKALGLHWPGPASP